MTIKNKMDSVSTARILLHFNVHQPVEIMDLTRALNSIARQYQKYVSDKLREDISGIKLYITKIENNCILAELAGATDILGTLFSVMEYSNIFIEFIKNINDSIKYFKSLAPEQLKAISVKSIERSKRECEDIDNLLKVVSGNEKNKLGLSVVKYGTEEKYISFEYKQDEIVSARKGSRLAQSILEEKGEADYKDVLMYFYQTNVGVSKVEGKTGEKALIKSVYHKELPVYIISDLDRERIMNLKDDPSMNLFKASYRVDVSVETDRNDIPRFYRVLNVHEIIAPEEEESNEQKNLL